MFLVHICTINTVPNHDRWQKYVRIDGKSTFKQQKYVHIAKVYFRLVTKFIIFEDSVSEESSAVSFTLELPLSIFFLYSYCIPLPSTQPSPFSQQSVSSGSISHSKLLSGARQYILYFTLGNLQGMQARSDTMKSKLF